MASRSQGGLQQRLRSTCLRLENQTSGLGAERNARPDGTSLSTGLRQVHRFDDVTAMTESV